MLQVVNTTAPAMPLERPPAGASRRLDAGNTKAADPFAALVDESVRSAAEHDEPSPSSRPSVRSSREGGDEPAADATDADGTRDEAPDTAVVAAAAAVWIAPPAPPEEPVGGPGDMFFDVVAADPSVTSIAVAADDSAGRDAQAAAAAPSTATASVPASSTVPGSARDLVAAGSLPDSAAVLATADAANADAASMVSQAQQDGPSTDAADAAASSAEPLPVRATPQRATSRGEAHASHGQTGPAAAPGAGDAPAPELGAAGATAGDAPSSDAASVAPRWNARLASELQRALKTTGDRAPAAGTEATGTPDGAPMPVGAVPVPAASFAGGSGGGTFGDAPAGPRGLEGSTPVSTVPAQAPVDFARYLAAAASPESRAAGRALDEVAPQLVQAMRLQATQGGGEVRVQLRPEHLGAVTIDLRVEHGRVSASFNAEVPAVRQWLEAHEGSLRQGLSDQGLHLERFVVSKDGESPQRDSQGHEDARRRQTRRGRPDEEQVTFEVIV